MIKASKAVNGFYNGRSFNFGAGDEVTPPALAQHLEALGAVEPAKKKAARAAANKVKEGSDD